jgi:hypothetical protein
MLIKEETEGVNANKIKLFMKHEKRVLISSSIVIKILNGNSRSKGRKISSKIIKLLRRKLYKKKN